MDNDDHGFAPTMQLKWFAPAESRGWGQGSEDSGQPKACVYGYEGMRDYYVLKQLWKSSDPSKPDEWRAIEVG